MCLLREYEFGDVSASNSVVIYCRGCIAGAVMGHYSSLCNVFGGLGFCFKKRRRLEQKGPYGWAIQIVSTEVLPGLPAEISRSESRWTQFLDPSRSLFLTRTEHIPIFAFWNTSCHVHPPVFHSMASLGCRRLPVSVCATENPCLSSNDPKDRVRAMWAPSSCRVSKGCQSLGQRAALKANQEQHSAAGHQPGADKAGVFPGFVSHQTYKRCWALTISPELSFFRQIC